MKSFPMFLRTSGRRIVIAGGGEQAAQKARLALKTDAEIRVISPVLDDELAGMVRAGRVIHDTAPVTADSFRDNVLVFIATGCPATDTCLHAIAKGAGALVNVVDRPELCDATTPSIVDRDPVVVAIGTEGTAPVLARRIKTEVERSLPPRLGHLAALAGHLRGAVAERLPVETRRGFWAWVFGGAPARMHKSGAEEQAAELIKSAIQERSVPEGTGEGHIALVGAGPGARDLLTLRAVERLQEADVIFYDRLVDPEVLELARRDAERVFVGKEVGAHAWPQERICRIIVAEARKGRNVVRLKSGDPGIFGRASEELAAAREYGIATEIVPGVTAASAAAASLGVSLTERGETDTLVLTTGTCRPGDGHPDWGHHVRQGTTLALYMGVRNADAVRANLLRAGAVPETAVDVVADVSKAGERHLTTMLSELPDALESSGVSGNALILFRFSKREAVGSLDAAVSLRALA